MSYIFLQHYWWFIISLFVGFLVFLLFVQGGQSLLFCLGRTPNEKSIILNTVGHKWKLTFTTLVTFGGLFFASFPLFYSTSFGGAIYVWFAILVCFILQAVSFEFRGKPNNILGAKTFEYFLVINGVLAPILLGTAVGTFFTGANFTIDYSNILSLEGSNVISSWGNPWHGLEAVTDYRNVSLGLAIFFLSRVLGIQYILNAARNESIEKNSKRIFFISSCLFLIFFLVFFISILFAPGWQEDAITKHISIVDYKYFNNMIEMPIITIFFLIGVVAIIASIILTILKQYRKSIWISGVGTILAVTTLILFAGYNGTSFYPSLIDTQSSLTITNSSSSIFSLKAMTWASLFIPFVFAYVWYAWKQMSKKKISDDTIKDESSY